MFIPSTFKRPVSSWKALNLRKTLLMASSVRLKPLNCSRLPCRSEERFSRNAETDLVCRLLLEKKKNLSPARHPQAVVPPRALPSTRPLRVLPDVRLPVAGLCLYEVLPC